MVDAVSQDESPPSRTAPHGMHQGTPIPRSECYNAMISEGDGAPARTRTWDQGKFIMTTLQPLPAPCSDFSTWGYLHWLRARSARNGEWFTAYNPVPAMNRRRCCRASRSYGHPSRLSSLPYAVRATSLFQPVARVSVPVTFDAWYRYVQRSAPH